MGAPRVEGCSFRCSLKKVRELEMGTLALKSKHEDSRVSLKPSLERREHSGLEVPDERPVGVPQAFQWLFTLGPFPRTQT